VKCLFSIPSPYRSSFSAPLPLERSKIPPYLSPPSQVPFMEASQSTWKPT
jgi:hypothetical protein